MLDHQNHFVLLRAQIQRLALQCGEGCLSSGGQSAAWARPALKTSQSALKNNTATQHDRVLWRMRQARANGRQSIQNIDRPLSLSNVCPGQNRFAPRNAVSNSLPGATIGVLSVFLVRMMNSALVLTGGATWKSLSPLPKVAALPAPPSCRLAPSAASKRLSDLEAALAHRCWTAQPWRKRPTAAGQALLQRSRGLLEEARRIGAEVRSYGEGLSGYMCACSPISRRLLEYLPAALAQFAKAWPGIRVELEEHVPSGGAGGGGNAADVGVVSLI